ncbi:MAG: UDP-2,4-diacetamido-2,4,6-trideoxy-beta-L-altropyranose hydrolase [Bacteroidota bacterium]
MKPKIIFRADGDRKMGLGHLFRTLALAEMLKAQFYCCFMTRCVLPSVHKRILEVCESLIKLPSTKDHSHEARSLLGPLLSGNEVVVLDGYHFDREYQTIVRSFGSRLVYIDDLQEGHYIADVVINHAGGLVKKDFRGEDYVQFFLGPNYALLRKEFCAAARHRLSTAQEHYYFICLGGADPHNDTLRVLRRCEEQGHAQRCFVITGAAYAYGEELDRYIRQSKMDIIRLSDLDAIRMVKVMQQCGTAVCPPSSIAYEYLCVGGLLYLHQIADNQDRLRRFMLCEHLAFSFDQYPIKDAMAKAKIKQQQRAVFRGDSPKNILQIFNTICDAVNMPNG